MFTSRRGSSHGNGLHDRPGDQEDAALFEGHGVCRKGIDGKGGAHAERVSRAEQIEGLLLSFRRDLVELYLPGDDDIKGMGGIRFADEHLSRLVGSVSGPLRQRLQLFGGDPLE